MNIDEAYKELVMRVLIDGFNVPSRVGDTLMCPGLSLKVDKVYESFPIITTRKIYWRGVMGELAAFIRGADTLAEFERAGCKYWKHNAEQWDRNEGLAPDKYKVGKIYGYQWRYWGESKLDQLKMLIDGLKKDPFGRRHVLTTWNPEQLDDMCLPPCHLLCQFIMANDGLHCVVYMRSVDIALGLPSDLVLYGMLHQLVAQEINTTPFSLTFQFGNAHIYEVHRKQLMQQIMRIPVSDCPKAFSEKGLFDFEAHKVDIMHYYPKETITYELL